MSEQKIENKPENFVRYENMSFYMGDRTVLTLKSSGDLEIEGKIVANSIDAVNSIIGCIEMLENNLAYYKNNWFQS